MIAGQSAENKSEPIAPDSWSIDNFFAPGKDTKDYTMRKQIALLVLSAAALVFLPAAPASSAEKQENCPQLIENKCAGCHFVDYICPGIRKNKGSMAWGRVVNDMIKEGAKISREEKGQLTACLSNPKADVKGMCANSIK